MNQFVYMALAASIFTWLVTALGAATVLFFKSPKTKTLNLMLGFASGVMIAASFWSLLEPAIERAKTDASLPPWLVAAAGFLCGALFMLLLDKIVSCVSVKKDAVHAPGSPSEKMNRIILLILSITLHNIPEGLAVGVAFGALQSSYTPEGLMGAVTIAAGIGLQNFPEGAAVSIPLRREGFSASKSFFFGQASGLVEPAAGLAGALLVVYAKAILPYALSFAAGAMILVAVHELIPECQQNRKTHPYSATMGIIMGFAIMMLLDVMLG